MAGDNGAASDAGTPSDGTEASEAARLRELGKKIVRGTLQSDRLGGQVPNRLTQTPPTKLKQNRPIDTLMGLIAPPKPSQSPVAKWGEAINVPEAERDKTSGAKKTAPGEVTGNLPLSTIVNRLTRSVDQGLAPASGQGGAGARGRKTSAEPFNPRPLLLIGKLDSLTPDSLPAPAGKNGSAAAGVVPTDRVDYRKAKGFNEALEASLRGLGYPMRDAEVRDVSSNAEFLKAARAAGQRQVFYFGEASGPGALWPAGKGSHPVDRAEFEKATQNLPSPILLGCVSPGAPVVGEPAPPKAIGLDRMLTLDHLSAELRSPRVKAAQAKDIKVSEIDLSVGLRSQAPPAPAPR